SRASGRAGPSAPRCWARWWASCEISKKGRVHPNTGDLARSHPGTDSRRILDDAPGRNSMSRRVAWLVSLLAAVAIGYWIAGPRFYETFIGLDPSAFPLGAPLDRVGRVLADLGLSEAGILWSLLLLVPAGVLAFFLVGSAGRSATSRSR